jgi:hypothetical protein
LIALWEASDRLCSKRLKPIIPVLLPALERHGQLAIDEAIRVPVLAISPATIDRLLSEVRLVAHGGRPTPGFPVSAAARKRRCRTGRRSIALSCARRRSEAGQGLAVC